MKSGCFLLADNYCKTPLNNDHQITLITDGFSSPFGGINGMPQWKFEEGKEIILQKQIGKTTLSITMKYEGKSFCIKKHG